MTESPTVTPTEPLEQGAFEDYWGTDETVPWYFPDGKQYMTVKIMTEGDRQKFERDTSQDLLIDRQTQNTHVKMDMAKDRHALIKAAVSGWNLKRRNRSNGQLEDYNFSEQHLTEWLRYADPRLVDQLALFIRKTNPWLFGEMTVEQVEEDIERLQKVRDDLIRREEGKESSTNK
jgi:hypothetical protein